MVVNSKLYKLYKLCCLIYKLILGKEYVIELWGRVNDFIIEELVKIS